MSQVSTHPGAAKDRRRIRRRRPLARLAFTLLLSGSLSGCLNSLDDPNLLSSSLITPRLQNGEAERGGPVVNANAFNADQRASAMAPFAGFVGTTRVEFAGDLKQTTTDVGEIRRTVGAGFNPDEAVTVDFDKATINFMLQQLLGGALGVNYVAPADLGGSIDFRTEQPIPKSRILQVVRDLLGRNNLVIRFINGVYHIGPPELIEAMQQNAAAGRGGEEATRIVKLGRPNAAKVVDLASQLLPPNVSVVVSSAADTIVVRADPNDADSVETLLKTLSSTAMGSDAVAIIPLSQSAPEAVATGLREFYQSTLRGDETPVTIIPLQSQQAILVGTSDPELMAGVQQLARQLDRSVTDLSSLRVIPLTHLQAVDIAPQLSQIFGSAGGGSAAGQPAGGLGGVESEEPLGGVRSGDSRTRLQPRAPRSTIQTNAVDDNEDGSGLAIPGPAGAALPQALAQGAVPVARTRGNRGNEDSQDGNRPSARPAAGAAMQTPAMPGETRIVPDTRTNTLLVYSTFSVYKRMREVVQTLDVAQAQVVIEATVVEVDLTDALESGVQFFLQSNGIVLGSGVPSDNQTPRTGGVIGVGGSIGNVEVTAVLSALSTVTNFKVVSSPYLTVLDGKSARLVIGDQIPFATRSQSSNNLGNVTVTQDVEVLDTGVVLEITPRIHANNSVDLQINQSVSTPSSTASAGDLTPVIATRDIQSQVLAQSGRTVLLGGLIQDRLDKSEDAVPKLSRVPLIGNLFKQQTSQARRTELIVMITPRVVRSSSEIENLTRMIQASQVGANAEPPQPIGAVYKP